MADTAVAITAGTGTNIDTRTEGTNGNHRQVVVIGDPATNAGVAPVDATSGLSVNVTNASLTVASHAVTNAGTFAVQVTSAPSTAVTNAGTFAVQNAPIAASTATLANVSGATSSTTLQASNSARLGLIIVNDSTAVLYVKFGSSASSTSYTVQLQGGESYSLPTQGCRYTGIVTGIWASATGAARMTELTA